MAGRVIKDVSNRTAKRVYHRFVCRGSPVTCQLHDESESGRTHRNALRGAVEQMGVLIQGRRSV